MFQKFKNEPVGSLAIIVSTAALLFSIWQFIYEIDYNFSQSCDEISPFTNVQLGKDNYDLEYIAFYVTCDISNIGKSTFTITDIIPVSYWDPSKDIFMRDVASEPYFFNEYSEIFRRLNDTAIDYIRDQPRSISPEQVYRFESAFISPIPTFDRVDNGSCKTWYDETTEPIYSVMNCAPFFKLGVSTREYFTSMHIRNKKYHGDINLYLSGFGIAVYASGGTVFQIHPQWHDFLLIDQILDAQSAE